MSDLDEGLVEILNMVRTHPRIGDTFHAHFGRIIHGGDAGHQDAYICLPYEGLFCNLRHMTSVISDIRNGFELNKMPVLPRFREFTVKAGYLSFGQVVTRYRLETSFRKLSQADMAPNVTKREDSTRRLVLDRDVHVRLVPSWMFGFHDSDALAPPPDGCDSRNISRKLLIRTLVH